ncbi:Mth938-like domain-containing protein [Cohaesibacter marisflavi]|uniref:Mth938-like domain-containing protein n=1 Tax=Cohaesibacter marisflavi TaxID=655353 RepID=UPI0029C928D1|nr:MTH938/NDUFAF3 family protein [Cohaesibacter marisflavi]
MAPASGLEMTDAYYPGHDPIDFYGNGGFRFGEMSHQGAILFLPSGVHRWDVETVNALTTDHFEKLLAESRDIELLILGTGNLIVPLAQSLANHIRQAGIKLDIMDTGAAVRTLNILLSEDRAVAAALFPVS